MANKNRPRRRRPKHYNTLYAYVDGSFSKEYGVYGSGAVITDGQNVINRLKSHGTEQSSMRNVAGEIAASIMAVEYAEKKKPDTLVICYDYEGIEKWATHVWKANLPATKDYAEFMNKQRSFMLEFRHVKAHSGIKFNEMADKLAGEAVKEAIKGMDPVEKPAKQVESKVFEKFKGKRTDLNVKKRIELFNVNEKCLNDIEWFYKLNKHTFKDYSRLKAYGRDGLSAIMRESYFEKVFSEDECNYVKRYLKSESDRLNAYRWACRGLLIEDAVFKADADFQLYGKQ